MNSSIEAGSHNVSIVGAEVHTSNWTSVRQYLRLKCGTIDGDAHDYSQGNIQHSNFPFALAREIHRSIKPMFFAHVFHADLCFVDGRGMSRIEYHKLDNVIFKDSMKSMHIIPSNRSCSPVNIGKWSLDFVCVCWMMKTLSFDLASAAHAFCLRQLESFGERQIPDCKFCIYGAILLLLSTFKFLSLQSRYRLSEIVNSCGTVSASSGNVSSR